MKHHRAVGEQAIDQHAFCDTCRGCRPAIVTVDTGRELAEDDPLMIRVNRIWDHHTSYAQRKAYIEVTVHNSRDPENIRLSTVIINKFQEAFQEALVIKQ